MKILVDIGHPAHVHYFKNFIYEMSKRKHKFLVVARNKEVSIELLNAFKITILIIFSLARSCKLTSIRKRLKRIKRIKKIITI